MAESHWRGDSSRDVTQTQALDVVDSRGNASSPHHPRRSPAMEDMEASHQCESASQVNVLVVVKLVRSVSRKFFVWRP